MSARDLAFAVLKDWKPHGTFAGERLEGLLRKRDVSPQDRRLATELVFGVIRRQATLDALIAPQVSRPRREVEPVLWMLLRLGAYQLTFLAGMADHAAVNETVELAKRSNKRWGGFVNAVLRKVAGSLTDEVLSTPTADGIPLADGRFRLATTKLFADPDENPAAYFADAYSFPSWLAKRWATRFDADALFALGRHFNASPRMTIRVDRMKASVEQMLSEFKAAGVKAKAGVHPDSIRLADATRVEELPGFVDGRITVQDETAMFAATLLAPRSGERVLDLCAAPGTKTTHIAELMNDTGVIVACDINNDRLNRVRENVSRLGLTSVTVVPIDDAGNGVPHGEFDRVLVDVPCSNTGVLGKRPEARWRIAPNDLKELPAKQAHLLALALDRVRRGGHVAYSTCSIEPEENEQVVKQALAERDEFTVLESQLYLPGRPADGGFQVLIERR